MIDRIVVAWDASLESRTALGWAVSHLGRHDQQEVRLVQVLDEVTLGPGLTFSPDEIRQARVEVEHEAAVVHNQHPDLIVTQEVVVGDTLTTLRRFTEPSTLLVIGTQSRSFPHFRFGWSVGARLIPSALGPVAIVPTHVKGEREGVVVGVDGTQAAQAAALFAADEAVRLGTSLRIVHTWSEPITWGDSFIYQEDLLTELRSEHNLLLRETVDLVRASHPDLVLTSESIHGSTVQNLLESTPLPSLVVVGHRSRSAINRLILGSTSHELILNLDVPAIIVSDRVRGQFPTDIAKTSGTQTSTRRSDALANH